MGTFGTITRDRAVELTAGASRGGAGRQELQPYREAITALLADVDGNAGTITLGEGDKLAKERSRLRAAFQQVVSVQGLDLPRNAIIVKKSGNEVIFYVDPSVEPAPPKARRARRPKESTMVEHTPQINGIAAANARNGKASKQAVAVGADDDDIEV